MAHRKIIVHDDGAVCQRTYNKVCPMVHEDEEGTFDLKSIPMYHEDPTIDKDDRIVCHLVSPKRSREQGMGGPMMMGGMDNMSSVSYTHLTLPTKRIV